MGWGDTSTAGDPGEQSAADASQSASVDSATAGSNAGSIGGVGGGNDGNGTGTMDPGQMQAAGLNAGYGFAAQDAYNTAHGITATNPYGKQGFFSRVFGIDPSKIDYSGNMDLNTRMGIANNQFSKYANPQNKPGMLGYNPDFPTAKEGELRAGAQSAGFKTKFGDVMGQARQQTTSEMIARGLMSLTPLGPIVGMLDTQEYGLPGQPGFESFDPNNPRAGGGILSAMLGGLNPTQAKEALVGAFAPVAPAPTPTQIGSVTPSQYETRADIIARTSQHPLTGETSIVDGLNGFQTETLPDGSVRSVQTTGGMTKAEADEIKNNFESTKNLSAEEAAARAMERLENSSYNFYTDPQAGGTYPSAMAGEQLAGLFGENPKAAGFRSLGESIKSIINKENLPDNQNMYGPGMPDQTPLTPDELNDILAPSGMELGRGPATANQYAQVDYSNLSNVGGNMYQAGQQKSAFDSFLETFGMKEVGRRPSGQIYSPAGKNKSFFDYIGFGQ